MTIIKKIIGAVRERRLHSVGLRKLDGDQRGALIALGVLAILCVIDGEVSDDERDELREAWKTFTDSMGGNP
jgi:hypothetical protein